MSRFESSREHDYLAMGDSKRKALAVLEKLGTDDPETNKLLDQLHGHIMYGLEEYKPNGPDACPDGVDGGLRGPTGPEGPRGLPGKRIVYPLDGDRDHDRSKMGTYKVRALEAMDKLKLVIDDPSFDQKRALDLLKLAYGHVLYGTCEHVPQGPDHSPDGVDNGLRGLPGAQGCVGPGPENRGGHIHPIYTKNTTAEAPPLVSHKRK
jgi:hypothetical protein